MRSALVVTTLPPCPAFSGGRQRTLNFLLELARTSQVTLLFPDGPGGAETERTLAPHRIEVLRSLPYRRSLISLTDGYFRGYPWLFAPYVEAVEGDYRRLAPQQDLIYIDHLHLAPLVAIHECPGPKYLLDEHNVEGRLAAAYAESRRPLVRPFARRYARSIERFERLALPRFDLTFCASEADRATLVDWGGDPARIRAVTNGADYPDALPPPATGRALLFVGSLAWRPGVAGLLAFYTRVFRKLRARLPDLVFHIAGSGPPDRDVLALRADPAVRLQVDFEDPVAVYGLANVCVAPSVVPGGTKIKVAEGLLHGRHVVATAAAADGIAPRGNLAVADSVDGLEAPLLRLLTANRLPPLDRAALHDLTWDRARQEFRRRLDEFL